MTDTHDTYDRSFDELRTGFTAAVSHELRTPLARILVLLDSADLPGADVHALIDQARAEVENAGTLIDEILFLSEIESGKEVVALGHTHALPVLRDVAGSLEDSAARAGVRLEAEGDDDATIPLRPRLLRILGENLAENAIRYAGHGATFTLSVRQAGEFVVLTGADDGAGVDARDTRAALRAFLPRGCSTDVARHGARSRDRQAHGGRGRRRRAGRRRAGPRPSHPLHVPGLNGRRGARWAPLPWLVRRAYWWTDLSVFSEATRTGFGSGAKSSFAVYCDFCPWVSAQKIIFRSSAECEVCCGTITYVYVEIG